MTSTGGWLALVTNLPTQNAAHRMRVLRTLESMGCAVLREGVYFLPRNEENRQAFRHQTEYIVSRGGQAFLLEVERPDPAQDEAFKALFDRSREYTELAKSVRALKAGFGVSEPTAIARILARQRREFEALVAIDFFPGKAREEAEATLVELESAVQALAFPGEGGGADGAIERREVGAFRGRVWATRGNPWADRLASAWLIRRFIDPDARFAWLDKGDACPARAVSFAYDGAEFNNTGKRVTFEVLAEAFGLGEDVGLQRLGALVRYLDIGGVPIAEASGVETLLLGAKRRCDDDDAVLAEACATFDLLYSAYSAERTA